LAIWRLKYFNETFVQGSTAVILLNFCAKNPPHRQAETVASNIMQTIPKTYYPPRNWQDFENLILDIAKYKIEGDFDKYGREGQSQDGVDIWGRDKKYKSIGIQCKYKKRTTSTVSSPYFSANVS